MSVKLWVEAYRPRTIDQYVWRDPTQKAKVLQWIKEGAVPHLLFSGKPGTGKTSLAELILRELQIPSGDILKINASRERKIEDIQDKIKGFISTWSLGPTGIKYIILDEADSLSPLAQRMLRGDMESYSDSVRLILTCNYPKRISTAIHSRCQGFHFETLDEDDFVARAGEILMAENVEFDVETLLTYTAATYPDLRKCINALQQHVQNGVLGPFPQDDMGEKDYIFEMVNLFRAGQYLEARKLIVSQAQLEEYPDLYRFFYRNLDIWGDTQAQQDDALLIIRRGVLAHPEAADAEINLAATIVELCRVRPQ